MNTFTDPHDDRAYKIKNILGMDTFTDPRDGLVYKIEEIVGLTWMAENLKFEAPGSWPYDNDPEEVELLYGRLYTWESALAACPEGWRLPTDEDWKDLAMAFRNSYDLEKDPEGVFCEPRELLDSLCLTDDSFLLGYWSYHWGATERDADSAWVYHFDILNGRMFRYDKPKSSAFSVRCVKL